MVPNDASPSIATNLPSWDRHTYRACTEGIAIRALLDGLYKVHSQSGRTNSLILLITLAPVLIRITTLSSTGVSTFAE